MESLVDSQQQKRPIILYIIIGVLLIVVIVLSILLAVKSNGKKEEKEEKEEHFNPINQENFIPVNDSFYKDGPEYGAYSIIKNNFYNTLIIV